MRSKKFDPLVVVIPNVKFDGKPFTYFLGRNEVEFYPQSDDPKNRTFIFASLKDRMFATVIWRTLTGSEVLGRLLSL